VQGTTTNAYNGDGTLVAQTVGSVTTRYTQDLASPLSQILSDGTTTSVYGMERLYGLTGSTRTWYGSDALGSVRQTLNDSGSVLGAQHFDPWGQVQRATIAPFGFTGELQQGASVYLRARWYNAGSGSFGSRDSFAGRAEQPYSLHYYQYGYANPVSNTDPSGQCVFVGIDTLICAGVAITIGEAIILLSAAGITTYAAHDICVNQHVCDQLAADLTRLLPDAAAVNANRANLKRGIDFIASGGNRYVWNDTPPVLNTGNPPPLPPAAPGTPPMLGQVPQLGVNVQGDALPAETAPCPETFPLDLVDRGSLRSAQWPNAAQQRGPVVLAQTQHSNIGYLPQEVADQIQKTVDEVGAPLYVVGSSTRRSNFGDIDYAANDGSEHDSYTQAWRQGRLPKMNPAKTSGLSHPPLPIGQGPYSHPLNYGDGVIEFRPNQPPKYYPPKR